MNLAAKYALQEAPFHVADFDYLFGETTFFVPTCQHVILPVFKAS